MNSDNVKDRDNADRWLAYLSSSIVHNIGFGLSILVYWRLVWCFKSVCFVSRRWRSMPQSNLFITRKWRRNHGYCEQYVSFNGSLYCIRDPWTEWSPGKILGRLGTCWRIKPGTLVIKISGTRTRYFRSSYGSLIWTAQMIPGYLL